LHFKARSKRLTLRRLSILSAAIIPAAMLAISAPPALASTISGIDMSHFQHSSPVNWSEVASTNRFVISKATQGDSYTDPYFTSDYAAVKNAGMYRGAYHFAEPGVSSAVSQADHFVNTIGDTTDGRTLPPVVDLEYKPGGPACWGLSQSSMVSWIGQFLDRLRTRTGRTPMIYTSASWWSSCTGNTTTFNNTLLWVVDVTHTSPVLFGGWSKWTFWQYGQGPVAGISGDVDLDRFNGDATALAALAGGATNSQPVCLPLMGDWDGANGDSLGVACHGSSALSWNLMNANMGGSPAISSSYGSTNCLPVTGDWNGDGRDTIGVACKNSTAIDWYLSNGFSGTPSYQFSFGNSGCWPVTGDWNGDGRDTVGVACKNDLGIAWNLIDQLSGGSPTYQFGFGNSNSCEPVTGDFNNDRRTTIGVACYGGSSIAWNLMNILAGGSPQITASFGSAAFYQPPSTTWTGAAWPGWPY
jgi:GH25 family lysozyme M1 (1,4-beta-N-acetylmuramidase)